MLRRMTTENYNVPNSTTVIEKGTMVMIPTYAIHHDHEYYPAPDTYDPERFSAEEKKKRDPMAWLPFGDGRRSCIGRQFAQVLTRIGLITLLKNFEFTESSQMDLEIKPATAMLKIEGGVRLKLNPIHDK